MTTKTKDYEKDNSKTDDEKDNDKDNYKLISTGIFGVVIGLVLITITISFDQGNKPLTYLICTFGFILGWIAAIYTTPYDKNEKIQLNGIAKVVGTFLSGYILSKSDKVFEVIVSPTFIFNPLEGGRVLFFLSYFGLAWIVVFVYRQYATGELKINNPKKKPKGVQDDLQKE
jgi:hypothetical protein